MKKIIILSLSILLFSGLYLAARDEILVSVATFNENTMHAVGLGRKASAIAAGGLAELSFIRVRSRSEIEQYIITLEKVQLGLISPAAAGLKTLKEIDYAVVGSVAALNAGRQFEADLRMVMLDDFRVVFSAGGTGESLDAAMGVLIRIMRSTAKPETMRANEKNSVTADDAIKKDRVSVAVGVFNDRNPEAQRAGFSGAFADILNAALSKHKSIIAMDRINIGSILNEKTLTMSGIVEPNDRRRELAARDIDFIINGESVMNGGLTTISYRVERVADRTVILSGALDIALSKSLRSAAHVIAGIVEAGLVEKAGFLHVTSVPSGASVAVNGELRGATPLEIPLEKGKYEVRVSQDEFDTVEKVVDIHPRKTSQIDVALRALDLELFQKAGFAERREQWDSAISIYSDLIQKYPKTEASLTARYRIGWICQFKLNQTQKAKEYFSQLLAMYPGEHIRAEAYYGLASIYESSNETPKAIKMYKMLIKEYPTTIATEEAKNRLKMLE